MKRSWLKLLALLLVVSLVLELVDAKGKKGKKSKKAKDEDEDVDEGDDEVSEEDIDDRNYCIDDSELQDCNSECEKHPDCTRESHAMECEQVCRHQCYYIERKRGEKCLVNLAAIVNDYRVAERQKG